MRMSTTAEPRPNPLVRTLAKLHSHKHNLKRRFEIVRTLGEGTYGKVKLAINKYNGEQVAIKYIRKQRIRTEQDLVRIQREIKIMSSIKHPHIVNIMEVYENKEKIILVMEFASGGELYEYINKRRRLSEPEARRFFRQIVSAIHHCHKMGIVHRDLKLENIVMDGDGNVKIADFGLSNEFTFEHLLSTYCGSPLYASPEIVNGQPYYGPEIDCWSLGVLLYTLVYGAMPFDSSDLQRLKRQITEGDYFEPARPSDASSLIRLLLEVDPDKRATISTIAQHWWVNVGYTYSALDEGLDRNHLHVPLTSIHNVTSTVTSSTTVTSSAMTSSPVSYNRAEFEEVTDENDDNEMMEKQQQTRLRTLRSKDSGCGSFESVSSRRRMYNLQEMKNVLDSVDSGHGSLQHNSFSTTMSLDNGCSVDADLASSSPEVGDVMCPVRKRIRRHDALTNRYSYSSMSSNSSCDVLDFSYESLDAVPGRFSADISLEEFSLHHILKPKSKSAPASPDETDRRGRLCKAQYFDLEEAEYIYQQAAEIIKTN